jgi:hypothetical protein
MAFPGTGLTELGPYGVPVAITIPLFGEGAPLTIVVAEGIITIEEMSHGQISQGLIGHPEAQGKIAVEVDATGVITVETIEVG